MCSSAAQPQTQAVRPQGRAKSELRNVAPAVGRRPQKNKLEAELAEEKASIA
ncbi:hypothetical protein SGRA_1548 [Saprospira grandis str. Lewin]|uniref:Uncharacterized protein n=1 Tax=Saprospira grandis (strain Lewin) TaxID=984262 RepID=H6L9B1_SAPGL|nr:hypothetical protein SGRA_1548 [Saprospira grandis str. Lewin]